MNADRDEILEATDDAPVRTDQEAAEWISSCAGQGVTNYVVNTSRGALISLAAICGALLLAVAYLGSLVSSLDGRLSEVNRYNEHMSEARERDARSIEECREAIRSVIGMQNIEHEHLTRFIREWREAQAPPVEEDE